MRKDRWLAKYAELHEEAYDVAYGEAKVGQTTHFEADQIAHGQAHLYAMRALAQTDLYFLATEIFDMDKARVKGRRIWHEPFHGRLCDALQDDNDWLIWMSRNMLKTTVAKIWCVQQIIIDPVNVRIGMWSASAAKMVAELNSIKGMLVNKKLLELFPDRLIADENRWEKRTGNELTVTRKVPDEFGGNREIKSDENQIEVWGLDSNVVGRHYTHHYYDDIITDKNTTTINQLEKAREVYGGIQGLRSVDTIEKIIGTPWHSMDLYHYMIENGLIPKKNILKMAGITYVDGKEKILYPYFTKAFMAKQRRNMGENLYNAQYHLDTTPRDNKMFIRPYPYYTEEMFPEDPEYFISVDPSTGRTEKHDKTGICVAAVDRNNRSKVYFVEADSYTLEPEKLADLIVHKIIQYNPVKVGIELGLQLALLSLIRLKSQERKRGGEYVPQPDIREIKTGGGKYGMNKADKIDRTFGAMVRDQRALIKPEMQKLMFQMDNFNPHKQKNDDDIIDAASMMMMTIPYLSYGNWKMGDSVSDVVTYADIFRRKNQNEGIGRIFAS